MKRTQLTPDAWVFRSTLYQTNTTLVRSAEHVFLVDPNWLPGEIAEIQQFVFSIRDHRKLVLLFTHSDYDHIVGYGAFQADHVIASQAFADNPKKADDVAQAIRFDQSHYIARDYPIVYPEADMIIHSNGQQVCFPGVTCTFFLTPGHTAEGMFTIFEEAGIWIAGDYLSDLEFPLIHGTLAEYRETLSLIESLPERHHFVVLVPGHGTAATTSDEIRQRIRHAREYLRDIELTVAEQVPFPSQKYATRYSFWEGIQDWHRQNLQHIAALQTGR